MTGASLCDVSFRDLRSPVTPEQLQTPHPQCQRVQFSSPLTEADHKLVARFLQTHPHLSLRVYGHHSEHCDLGFLRHYPQLRRLGVDVFELDSLDALHEVHPGLEELALGQTRSRAHSLAFLRRFSRLRRLGLECHTKDIAAVRHLSHLEVLSLTSLTLADLEFLRPLHQLRSLAITLGGTTNLDVLPSLGRLRFLGLRQIRGLADLSVVAELQALQFLFLRALRQGRRLPSLSRLRRLRRVHLETMKGLTDLQPVADAPAIESLVVHDMRHLTPEAFQPFAGHPTLRSASVYLGSDRKNKAVAELLGLPESEPDFQFDEPEGAD